MNNHANRSRRIAAPGRNPKPTEITRARLGANLTTGDAGARVWSSGGMWSQWEAGDRRMHPALWELFCIKTKQEHLFNPESETSTNQTGNI